jgi:TIR domain/Effector-associated domain 11/Tetratricopeptide repeat
LQLTPEQAKSIVDAIQEADFPQAFERLDSYGPTGPEINLLRKEFISGRYGFDFAGRFQLAINALAGTSFAISQKEYDYYRQPTKANFKRMLAQDMDEAIRLALELLGPVEAQYRAEFDGLIQVAGRRNGLKEDKLNGVLRQEDERVGQAQVLQSLTYVVNKLPEDLFQGWQRPSPAPDLLPKPQMLGDNGFEFDLFFSFSSQNKAAATQIVQTLRGNGLRIFFSDEDLQHHAGQSFFEKINYALKHSEHFVLYCTPAAMQSGWVKQEYSSFYQHSHLPSQEARRFFVLAGEGFRLDLLPLMLRNLQVSPSVDDVLRALGRELVPDDLAERQADYQELVELFFADGVISALERRQLQKKQRDTKLTDAQVASIEAGVTLAWQTQHAEEERKRIEAEKLRQEELAEQERLQKEKEEIRKQKEAEEAEKLRQEKLAEEQKIKEAEENARQQKAAEEVEKLRQEKEAEELRLRKEKAEAAERERQAEEAEKIRLEKLAEEVRLQKEKEAAEAEETTWQAAHRADSEAAYRGYLQQYPNGRYQAEARQHLARLPRTGSPPTPTGIRTGTRGPFPTKLLAQVALGVVALALGVFVYWKLVVSGDQKPAPPPQDSIAQVQPRINKSSRDTTGLPPDSMEETVVTTNPQTDAEKAAAEEEKEWRGLGKKPTLAALRRFVAKHPKGRYAPQASERLAELVNLAYQAAMRQGNGWLTLGEYEKAQNAFETALQSKPNHPQAKAQWQEASYQAALHQGDQWDKLGETEKAKKAYEKARGIRPNSPEVRDRLSKYKK